MKKPVGRCALCLQDGKELQNSHAIPNAIFKPILAANQGAGISISTNMSVPTHYSGDSWKEPQLCRECEQRLNSSYENAAILALRRACSECGLCPDGFSISGTNLGQLRSFFASVLWRASVWKHAAYAGFHLRGDIAESLRQYLLQGSVIPPRLVGVRLRALTDQSGGTGHESMQQVVCNPFYRQGTDFTLIVCCFGGFLIEAKLDGYIGKERQGGGVLRDSDRAVIAPWVDFTSVPELLEMGVISLHKEKTGNTKLKGKDREPE